MIAPTHGHPGRWAGIITAIGACMMLFAFAGTAYAAEATLTPVQQLQEGPWTSFTCSGCHAEISDTKLPSIKFSHASHLSYECRACHPRFPHQRTNIKVTPGMKECWNCHALRHGPQGIMAQAECAKCHTDYLARTSKRKPKDHGADWAGKPHVAPGNAELRTRCMMCHTKQSCDKCHFDKTISWETTQAFTYEPGNGCLACHGADLPRLVAPVTSSKLDASAHRDNTCAECHPDFRYDDKKGKTKLWEVNAGLACADCHANQKVGGKATKDWSMSLHGQSVLTGKSPLTGKPVTTPPTCSSCHGGHDIERLKTDAAKKRLYLSGVSMCGDSGCHETATANYNDWWHGAAYKAGNADAPACWSCHPAHSVQTRKDPASAVHPENIAKTCGKAGCHTDATETFAEGWRTLAHGQVQVKQDNPLTRLRASVLPGGR